MFSSPAAHERRKLSSAASASATPVPAVASRKRKANFSNDETETLVCNVVQHFSALYGAESFRAPSGQRRQLWAQIQSRVNFLGYTERSVDDLKHKWRDLRLDVKKKITARKSPAAAVQHTGKPYKPRLTALEKMVASTFFQANRDLEPEVVLDPEVFFPGASQKMSATSQSGLYINIDGQVSSLPELEGSVQSHLGVRSPDASLIEDHSRDEGQSSSDDPGAELWIPETSTVSPALRKDSRVSCTCEGEDEEGLDVDEDLDLLLSAEEDLKFSSQQAMFLHCCSSQGSLASMPEDTLSQADGHSEWGHDGSADFPGLGPQTEEEESEPHNAKRGTFPWGLMGPAWEKQPDEEDQPPSRSPFRAGTLTEESLPPASPRTGQESPSRSSPWGIGGSHPRESHREPWRTTLHRLMEMEDQWDQLYHHELATWQEERVQQQAERARDRDLQLRLLSVLTEIRDELRSLRQERASSRQKRASQTGAGFTSPCLCPKPETSLPETSSEHAPLLYPGKTKKLAGQSLQNSGQGGRGVGFQSPRGILRRGRGRPRGSMSHHKRVL